jgi:TetR/AcrR family transcriptional regulator, cholesterol catabolism regulator
MPSRVRPRAASSVARRPSRRRALPAAVREEQILDAAARLFRDRGFAGTTLRDVAAAAGILLGSLHYRFATKEAILVALMERGVSRALAGLREAVEGVDDPIERLRRALAAHLRTLVSGDDAVYVLLYDWRTMRGAARQAVVRLRDRYDARWDGIVTELADSGVLRRGVDRRLLRLLGLGAINWVATWYRPGGGSTPEQIADALVDALTRGVFSPEVRARAKKGAAKPASKPASKRSAKPAGKAARKPKVSAKSPAKKALSRR